MLPSLVIAGNVAVGEYGNWQSDGRASLATNDDGKIIGGIVVWEKYPAPEAMCDALNSMMQRSPDLTVYPRNREYQRD